MTKRLKSKHKVDRRLKANLWGRPKSPFNSRAYPPGQHGQNKKLKFVRVPKFEEVPYPVVMEPNLVIEYYSR